MDILFFTYLLNGLTMVILPIVVGVFLSRKLKVRWLLWWIGGAIFILSQIGHIPFNILLTMLFQQGILPSPPLEYTTVFNAVILGLSAGLWEETILYASYRWWVKDARSWAKALMLGTGRGGIESIILGVIVLYNFSRMYAMRGIDLSTLVPPEMQPMIEEQIRLFWSTPWYLTLLGAIERVFTLVFHMSAAVLVLQVFLRKQIRWLWIAVLWHAVIDITSVIVFETWGPVAAELVLGGLTLVSVVIIITFYQPETDTKIEPEGESQPDQGSSPGLQLEDIEETPENLEDTRFERFQE